MLYTLRQDIPVIGPLVGNLPFPGVMVIVGLLRDPRHAHDES